MAYYDEPEPPGETYLTSIDELCEPLTGIDTSSLVGDYAMAAWNIQRPDGTSGIIVGLFRRGADHRWRYAGSAQTVLDNPSTPCAVPAH